jgi:thiol-disulfide isomerase/thioredoxin/outer membrane lipoprotein-sorting protein
MKRIFLTGLTALAIALPALADEKGDALVAEVEAKAKTVTTFSASMSMKVTPTDKKMAQAAQSMTGKLLIGEGKKVRLSLKTPQGDLMVIDDGKSVYQITGKQFQKLPPAAIGQIGKNIWPPLLAGVGDFVGGIKDTKFITQKMLDANTVVDVVDVTGQAGVVRLYIDRDSLVRKVRLTPKQAPIVQDIVLSEMDTAPEITQTSFALPEGITEQKQPEAGGGLDAKLIAMGKPVPAFNLATPTGGKLSLASVSAGKKATLINFWFVGCPPCREEFPELQKLYAKLKSEGFGLVAVNQGDDNKSIQGFLKEKKITFPIVKGEDATFAQYGIQAFPTNYLLDGTGKVVYRSVGFDEAGLKAALKKLGLE